MPNYRIVQWYRRNLVYYVYYRISHIASHRRGASAYTIEKNKLGYKFNLLDIKNISPLDKKFFLRK